MRTYRLPTSLVAVLLSLWGLWLSPAEPAELRVRKELLIKQADQALITATKSPCMCGPTGGSMAVI